MEKCKYYATNVLCESMRFYRYLVENGCVGAMFGVRCPDDSGTDEKCNDICVVKQKTD